MTHPRARHCTLACTAALLLVLGCSTTPPQVAPATAPIAAAPGAPSSDHYVPAEQFRTVPFEPPPPPNSDAERADGIALLQIHVRRTDADCARAERTFFVAFDSFWGERSPFPQPLPAEVQAFFDRLDADIGHAGKVMKERFKRRRPDPPKPCPGPARLKKGGGYSYPSSHAAMSRVFAAVLTDLVPERRAEFFAHADAIAQDRVIIGAHYPADLVAGKALGDLFHAELLKSAVYRKDLEAVRALLLK